MEIRETAAGLHAIRLLHPAWNWAQGEVVLLPIGAPEAQLHVPSAEGDASAWLEFRPLHAGRGVGAWGAVPGGLVTGAGLSPVLELVPCEVRAVASGLNFGLPGGVILLGVPVLEVATSSKVAS